jgi:organic radical activating enzyme
MTSTEKFKPDDLVKSCSRIERGLRLAYDGIRACTFSTGAVEAPDYWKAEAVPEKLTKAMVVQKRRELFLRLNDEADLDLLCRKCTHWVEKKYQDVRFDQLEFLNVAHFSACNLRCDYCGFTKENHFHKEKYSSLNVLNAFKPEDVTFESSVDFNPGEPTLMKDLDEHLDYFRKNRIRVRLYSNGVIYSQKVFEAIRDGTITWLIISVDAGTPSTYLKTKRADKFDQVISNLAKYREAEQANSGKVAAKYIFTENNLGTDDISGFVYAMLAVGINNIWLLYDYFLFHNERLDKHDHYIEAYTEMFVSFRKWGITPSHFGDGAAGEVIPVAKKFMDKTKYFIESALATNAASAKKIKYDLQKVTIHRRSEIIFDEFKDYSTADLPKIIASEALIGKKVVVVPSGVATLNLVDSYALSDLNVIAFGDLSTTKQGQKLQGIPVMSYAEIANLDYDVIVVTNRYFMNSILNDIHHKNSIQGKQIVLISDPLLSKRA